MKIEIELNENQLLEFIAGLDIFDVADITCMHDWEDIINDSYSTFEVLEMIDFQRFNPHDDYVYTTADGLLASSSDLPDLMTPYIPGALQDLVNERFNRM